MGGGTQSIIKKIGGSMKKLFILFWMSWYCATISDVSHVLNCIGDADKNAKVVQCGSHFLVYFNIYEVGDDPNILDQEKLIKDCIKHDDTDQN
jgi:hypothetical protein